MDDDVRYLGLTSLSAAVAQLAAPGWMARQVGFRDTAADRRLLRLMGARDAVITAGLFARPRPAGFLAARALADVADLALLARAALTAEDARQRRRALLNAAGVAAYAGWDLVALVRLRDAGSR